MVVTDDEARSPGAAGRRLGSRPRLVWVTTLGLKVEFEMPERRAVALQESGGFAIFLQQVSGPVVPNGAALWFQVEDVDAAFAEMSGRGIAFAHATRKTYWGYGAARRSGRISGAAVGRAHDVGEIAPTRAAATESLGKSDRRELTSQITWILRHLLKLAVSPASEPRVGWRETIADARTAIELVIGDSPSLRREVETLIRRQTQIAAKRAAEDLALHGEPADAVSKRLPEHGFTADQVLGDWFPDPPG